MYRRYLVTHAQCTISISIISHNTVRPRYYAVVGGSGFWKNSAYNRGPRISVAAWDNRSSFNCVRVKSLDLLTCVLMSFEHHSWKAQQLCNLIEQKDPDKLIKLTVDYPDNQNDYVPFLNTEIKIDSNGSVHSRLYRKPQKKPLTLHYNSHHTTRTKNATVESMYNTAEAVSNNRDNEKYSEKMIDQLLTNNGYNDRVLDAIKNKRKRRKRSNQKVQNKDQDGAILKLPYINEATSRKYRDAVRHSGLSIKIVEKPGRKLKDLLTDSRPLDKESCTTSNCRTCAALTDGECTTTNTVYHITCEVDNCTENYGRETYRPLKCNAGSTNITVVRQTQQQNLTKISH